MISPGHILQEDGADPLAKIWDAELKETLEGLSTGANRGIEKGRGLKGKGKGAQGRPITRSRSRTPPKGGKGPADPPKAAAPVKGKGKISPTSIHFMEDMPDSARVRARTLVMHRLCGRILEDLEKIDGIGVGAEDID